MDGKFRTLKLTGPWEGWRLYKDRLVSPDGYGFTPNEIHAIPALRAERKELALSLWREVAKDTAPHAPGRRIRVVMRHDLSFEVIHLNPTARNES